ncbi:hypothetical protein PG996_014039 [Apiospora saccharicola]|uniref:Uncharacterized protein n=1 Tax=Apiospora saccharicola TaxID=335842 RepID=A0ABR1TH72_9PEZI
MHLETDFTCLSAARIGFYDVVHIKYLLRAPPHLQTNGMVQSADESDDEYDDEDLTAVQLPSLDDMEEWGSRDTDLEWESTAPKGLLGAAFRGLTGVKPEVQVVNDYDEDITVVVSRYCAHRKLSSVGVEVSGTGIGLSFETASATICEQQ